MIDLTAFYPDTAPHRLKKPNKKFQGRTFARTARTDNSNGLSLFNGKDTWSRTVLSPKDMSTSLNSITVSLISASMDVQHNGEEIVEDKDQDNGKNNGCRCSLAYPFGPLLSIKALMASDDGDDGTKTEPLMRPPTRSQDSTKPRMDSMNIWLPIPA